MEYPDDVSTPTSDLTLAKWLINSTLWAKDARCKVVGIKDFYLNTEIERYKYMKLQLDIIPDNIIEQYSLRTLERGGWVYLEIRKNIYGLS